MKKFVRMIILKLWPCKIEGHQWINLLGLSIICNRCYRSISFEEWENSGEGLMHILE